MARNQRRAPGKPQRGEYVRQGPQQHSDLYDRQQDDRRLSGDLTADLPQRRGTSSDTHASYSYIDVPIVDRRLQPGDGSDAGYDDPQDAPARQLRDRGHARVRRARRRRALLVSTLLVLAVAIWVLFVFVFKISTITVGGVSLYNESVILSKFGYSVGDNLFAFSARAAERDIAAALPYLETVRISRVPPGAVHIEVTPSHEKYCFITPAGSRVITSPSLKVLRSGDNNDGLLEIEGVDTSLALPGRQLEIPDDAKRAAVDTLLAALQGDMLANCTLVDVTDIYDITLRCEGRFLIRLGTTVELDYKLQLAAQTIYAQLEPDATGVVDVSSAATSHAAYYTPKLVSELDG